MDDILRGHPAKGYRPCVGIALFSRKGGVFLGKRATKGMMPAYSWQMPQGGIDPGEAALAAAYRELYEETGIRSIERLGEVRGWLHYDLPTDVAAWRGRYRGQAQRWFAFRFTGDDSEINVLTPPDGHSAEFAEWRWAALSEAAELVVPFKRGVYEHVAGAFEEFAQSEDGLRPSQAGAI